MLEKKEFSLPKGPKKDASENPKIVLEPILSKEAMYKELKMDVHDLARLGVEQSDLIYDIAHELTKAKAELTVLKVTVIVILALITAIVLIFGGIVC